MSYRTISDIFPKGQRVFFHSGNFVGHHGVVESVDEKSTHPSAIFGFIIHVKLDNGKQVLVEKSEHITKTNEKRNHKSRPLRAVDSRGEV